MISFPLKTLNKLHNTLLSSKLHRSNKLHKFYTVQQIQISTNFSIKKDLVVLQL